jgi:hypothetical protein
VLPGRDLGLAFPDLTKGVVDYWLIPEGGIANFTIALRAKTTTRMIR